MITSTYNKLHNNTVFQNKLIHNTIIFTNINLEYKNDRSNYIATKIINMWDKINKIFDVAGRNKFNDKAYVNRRRIPRRNESSGSR